MAQTLRQQARRQVTEAMVARKRAWAERESQLVDAAVNVVTAIAARDRAEHSAAEGIAVMLNLGVTLSEIGDRCGLPAKEVTRLKRTYLDDTPATADTMERPARAVTGEQPGIPS